MSYFRQLQLVCFLFSVCLACGQNSDKANGDEIVSIPEKYANTITEKDLKELLYEYASDEFKGRDTGTDGEDIATEFLRNFYKNRKIDPAKGTEDYFQKMESLFSKYTLKTYKDSENVVAIIPGSEIPNEYIVITAHLDHIGVDSDGEVFNGANDNGSGTVAILEIAEAFKNAMEEGNGPKRSIVFLHVSGEERGLLGSEYYTDNPLYPLENTVVNLNMDMIGRLDPNREDSDPKYVYLIGSDRISQDLHDLSEAVNEKYTQLKLDYTYNAENDPLRLFYRSDHFNFAVHNIPIIFYFNGLDNYYHKVTDTADTINYDILGLRTKLIFHTVWEIANREDRIKLNSDI